MTKSKYILPTPHLQIPLENTDRTIKLYRFTNDWGLLVSDLRDTYDYISQEFDYIPNIFSKKWTASKPWFLLVIRWYKDCFVKVPSDSIRLGLEQRGYSTKETLNFMALLERVPTPPPPFPNTPNALNTITVDPVDITSQAQAQLGDFLQSFLNLETLLNSQDIPLEDFNRVLSLVLKISEYHTDISKAAHTELKNWAATERAAIVQDLRNVLLRSWNLQTRYQDVTGRKLIP